ncbi:hypothetical protein O9993_22025 [Vibrio lentus]|nr:hypothetical protein [Vibrio lentus]
MARNFSPLQSLRLAACDRKWHFGWRLLVTNAVEMKTQYATLVD